MSVCFLFYCTCRLLPSWWINVYIIWLHEEFIGQQFTPKPQTRNQRGTWMNVTPNAVQKISRPGRKRSAIFLFQTVSRHNVFIFYHSCHPLWKNFDQAPVKIDVEEPAIATWMYLKAALQVKHIDGWSGFVGFETPPPLAFCDCIKPPSVILSWRNIVWLFSHYNVVVLFAEIIRFWRSPFPGPLTNPSWITKSITYHVFWTFPSRSAPLITTS